MLDWRLQSLLTMYTLFRHSSAPYKTRGEAWDAVRREAMQKGKQAQVALSGPQPVLGITHMVASTWLHVEVRAQSGTAVVADENLVACQRTDWTMISTSEQARFPACWENTWMLVD